MNKKTILIIGAVAAGALLFISMRKKRRGYSIEVPPPERITAEEFERSTTAAPSRNIVQRVAPIVQSLFKVNPTRKAARQAKRAARRSTRRVGEFPEMF